MLAETREREGEIRGVRVRLVEVVVAGHIVEQVISYDMAEAEGVHSQPFGEDVDRILQGGMFAFDKIAGDEMWGRTATAPAYVLDGKCVRTRKIAHCDDIKPASAWWTITRPDGTEVENPPWSCVAGEPPITHEELTALRR